MKGSVTGLELLEPRSLHQALALMARDSTLIPIAGATDLYVALNAGSLQGRRFLDLWNLTALRRIPSVFRGAKP